MAFQTNLRRLLFFHHESARDAARALGVSEHTVSAWLTGKRQPNGPALIRMAELYHVDTRLLMGDEFDFAEHLGDRARAIAAERELGRKTLQALADAPLSEIPPPKPSGTKLAARKLKKDTASETERVKR